MGKQITIVCDEEQVSKFFMDIMDGVLAELPTGHKGQLYTKVLELSAYLEKNKRKPKNRRNEGA